MKSISMKSRCNCHIFCFIHHSLRLFPSKLFRCSIVKIHLQIILPSDDLGAKNHYYSFVTGQLFCWEVKPELLKTLSFGRHKLSNDVFDSVDPASFGLLTHHLSRTFVRNRNVFLLCSRIYCS